MALEDTQQAASRAVIRPSAEPCAGDLNNSEHWWWRGKKLKENIYLVNSQITLIKEHNRAQGKGPNTVW